MLERTPRLPPPPRAERRPKPSTMHGTTLVDEYAWLRAENWQEVMRDPSVLDPKIRAYLTDENDYTKAALAHTEALQQTLFAEMKGRIKEDDSTVPSPDGPMAYYVRYREGGQHPILCRQPRDGGPETVLLDGDALAAGKAYFQLGGTEHSPDHRLLAWSADEKGSEFDVLRVRDVGAGSDLPDVVPDVSDSPVWTADSTAFYYVRLDANHRPSRVYRHRLGTPAADDALVYEEHGQPLLRFARPYAVRPLRRHFGARSRDVGILADRSDRRGCNAASGRGARSLAAIRCGASSGAGRRGSSARPHQRRRRRRLQDHAHAARARPRARTGAI